MTDFCKLVEILPDLFGEFEVLRPKNPTPDSIWNIITSLDDGTMLEIGWNARKGFGLSYGTELEFGTGYDHVYKTVDGVLDKLKEIAR